MGASRRARQQSPHLNIPGAARSPAHGHSTRPQESPILDLQRAIGNRAVSQLLRAQFDGGQAFSNLGEGDRVSGVPASPQSPRGVQTKLAINSPGDVYEQEAERVSAQVTGMPAPRLQRMPTEASDMGQVTAPPIVREVLNSPGQPLDPVTRAFMEPRFGRDFGNIRIHVDERANASARAINARAYTIGESVVFAPGRFSPHTNEGRHLLAHELVHTIQQGSRPASKLIQRAPGESEDAAIGKEIERAELQEWRVTLEKDGYEVFTRQQFDKVEWLEKAIPSKVPRPDLVAVNGKTGKIIVGDITAGPWSTSELKPGDVRKLPHGIGAEVETKAHLEKTMDRAQQISRHLPDDLKHCDVVAQDRWWKEGGYSRQVTVSKGTKLPRGGGVGGGAAKAGESLSAETKAEASVKASAAEARTTGSKVASTEAKVGSAEAKVASTEAKVTRMFASFPELPRIGALDAALFYLDIHAPHFAALEAVSESVEIAKDLLSRVDEFESGARELKQVVDNLRAAESSLPSEPLQSDSTDPRLTPEELTYLSAYYRAAASIVSDAWDAKVKLNRIIMGWDAVVGQAKATGNFTRASAWDAVTQLDLRFSKQGGGFRNFLVDARDWAERVEYWARLKMNGVADVACVKEGPVGFMICLAHAILERSVR